VERREDLERRIGLAREFPEICRLQGALNEVLMLASMPETDALLRAAEVAAVADRKSLTGETSRTERRKLAIPGSR